MRIVVLIKQTLDPSGISVRRDKERVFVNREDYVLEAGSKAAIEAALRLREASGAEDWSVTALSMGKPQADDALREALAMGCDAAYLLTDKEFEDADISATVRILATAIQKLGGADLIIAGSESGDTGSGQIGARLAEALGTAQVTMACALSVEGGTVEATRRWNGSYATVKATLPAVATVVARAYPARYAPGARIMSAYREWEVTAWGAEDLGLDAAALAPVLSMRGESFPPPLEVGERLSGDPARVAGDAIRALRLQKLIP
jgi:electron transfer flavoprotein beta subunit